MIHVVYCLQKDKQMNDNLSIADQKLAAAARIRNAISGIKRQIADRGPLTILDRLLSLVRPGLAYKERNALLCFAANLHRTRSHQGTQWAVMLHDIGTLLNAYWALIRTDESVNLSALLRQVEDYAQYGFQQCDLLGDMEEGFYLFNKAAQDAAVADTKRKGA